MVIKDIITTVWDKSKSSFLSMGGGTLTDNLEIRRALYSTITFSTADDSDAVWIRLEPDGQLSLSTRALYSSDDNIRLLYLNPVSESVPLYLATKINGNWTSNSILYTDMDPIAANNGIKAVSLGFGTDVPENADLNDYWAAGNYRCSSSATGGTISNNPASNGAFTLKVFSATGGNCGDPTISAWQYQQQLLTDLGNNIFYRSQRNGGTLSAAWSDWKKVVWSDTSNNVSGLNTVSASKITASTVVGAVYN